MPDQNPQWTITTDDELADCAKQLWEDHHVASDELRGWDEQGTEFHRLMVHTLDQGDPDMAIVTVGTKLMLLDGKPKALSIAELQAWGVS
jgi:hypothetical protein